MITHNKNGPQHKGKQSSWPVRIITVNWNAYVDTARLLTQLKQLRYPAYEIVVVDNASTDGSYEQLRKDFPDAQLMRMPANVGFGAANNAALRPALADNIPFAWLINNDAVPDVEALTAMVSTLESNPTTGVCGSLIFDLDHPNTLQARSGGRIFPWLGYARLNKSESDSIDFITGTSMLLRLDALRDTGLFDESYFLYWEDADLCYRLQRAGWQLAASEGRVQHATSRSTKRNMKARSFHIQRSYTRFVFTYYRMPYIRSLCATILQATGKMLRGHPDAAIGAWQGWRAGLNIVHAP